jgi:hypothetical protein
MCDFSSLDLKDHSSFIGVAHVSHDPCDQIIAAFNCMDPHAGNISGGVDKKKKDSLDISLPPNFLFRKYQQELLEIVDAYRVYYRLDEYGPPVDITEHINIQKYPVGGAYHQIHCDRGPKFPTDKRELVFMTYLNDVREGGETEFMFQKIKIKPQKGLTLIWPTNWTHLHRGLPSSTDEKMIITGWLSSLL